eukprot:TRINITY_DN768_c0_g2_i1.p1 TRINITY_DN768_c0_g2~~TRINITY_DN768_c0_g2_i1.p1  ORF type:complete len:408 (+),score=104.75 TRINITY_DN768_c0_g2_i1:103-1326(+)
MQCVVPFRYIKLLAKSIQCMAKVGEDLYIEASAQRIAFRTLNASRSAFLAFYLDERFFESYTLQDGMEKKCQVKLKPCQAVFRQFNNIEKCSIILDENEQRLVFEVLCKHGIQKVYKLTFEECETVQAIYSKDEELNKIVCQPKKLIECINNFHNGLEEISIATTANSIIVKSYVDDSKVATKVLHTELSLDPNDFEEYQIKNDAQVTFCLKEFKAILSFCEASGQPVTLYFERGGRPICLSIKYFGVFESDFVLATLLEPYSQSTDNSNSAASSQSSAATPMSSNASNKRKFDDSQQPSWSSKASHEPPRLSQGPSPTSYSPSSVVRSDSSASQVIRSNDTNNNPQQYMNVDETNYGDYEEEVQGTPSPQDKRMRYTEEDTNDTVQAMQGVDEDDDEEIPCSVDEQ